MSTMPPPPPEGQPLAPSSRSDASAGPSQRVGSGQALLGTGGVVSLAGAGARLGARLLDGVLVAVAATVLVVVMGVVFADAAVIFLSVIAAAAAALCYEVTLTAVKGQTLGKMALRIKVVRQDNGLIPGWGKSLGRWIIPTALGAIPVIGWILALLVYLWLLWDPLRQGLHDKAVKTLVVKA